MVQMSIAQERGFKDLLRRRFLTMMIEVLDSKRLCVFNEPRQICDE
jgi:hypothetical protein